MSTRARFNGTFRSKPVPNDVPIKTLIPRLTNCYRYFSQRYSIFSWYDEGICMTDDAWFGVTPEPVAKSVHPVPRIIARFR